MKTELELKLERVESTLATLIVWITQSAGSPISVRNAQELLHMLGRETGNEDE